MPTLTIAGFGSFPSSGSGTALETDGTISAGTFAISGFTTNRRLVESDASKELKEVNLIDFMSGGTGVDIADDAAGGVTISFDGGDIDLEDLANVSIATPSSGQFLRYNGSNWINETIDSDDIPEGSTNLYITDERIDDRVASLISAGTNMSVVYDDGAGTLTLSSTAGTGGSTSFSGLSDTSISGVADGEVLTWNASGSHWRNRTLAEAGIAAASHTHAHTDITDFDAEVSAIITADVDKTFVEALGIDVPWSDITSKPSTFAPDAHTLDSHSNVTITTIASGEILKWNGSAWINNTLAEAGISATGHTHTTSDITDLSSYTGFDARYYTESEVDALTWAASDIVSGTFADARIAESNITQHEAALDIDRTQISGLTANRIAIANASGVLGTDFDLQYNITTNTLAGVNATFTGTVTGSNLNISNWDTAYGWGDHSTAGYITATLTNEQVQDIVGAMVTGNTETLITVTYQDADGTIDFVVDQASLNITESQISDLQTYATASNAMVFTNKTGNISQWTNDAGYITATLTEEQVEDYVGGMLSGNTETLITVTYQDSDGTIDFVVDNDLSSYDNATSDFQDTTGVNSLISSASIAWSQLTGITTATPTFQQVTVNNSGIGRLYFGSEGNDWLEMSSADEILKYYANSSIAWQSSASLFTINTRLLINDGDLDIEGGADNAILSLDTDAGNNASIRFREGNSNAILLQHLGSTNVFQIYDSVNSHTLFAYDTDTRVLNYNANVDFNILGDLDVTGAVTGTTATFDPNLAGVTAPTQSAKIGMELVTAGMNSGASKYGYGIVFSSDDPAFTTTSPKYLAGIFPYASEAYSSDTDSGMGIAFYATATNQGTTPDPTEVALLNTSNLTLNVNLDGTTATFSGSVTGSNLNVSNWDTAYSWGDHSTQNYAVSTGDTFTGALSMSGGASFQSFNVTNTTRRFTLNNASGGFPRLYNYDTSALTFHEINIGGTNTEDTGATWDGSGNLTQYGTATFESTAQFDDVIRGDNSSNYIDLNTSGNNQYHARGSHFFVLDSDDNGTGQFLAIWDNAITTGTKIAEFDATSIDLLAATNVTGVFSVNSGTTNGSIDINSTDAGAFLYANDNTTTTNGYVGFGAVGDQARINADNANVAIFDTTEIQLLYATSVAGILDVDTLLTLNRRTSSLSTPSQIEFSLGNAASVNNDVIYGSIEVSITGNSTGFETGRMSFFSRLVGVDTEVLRLEGNSINLYTNTSVTGTLDTYNIIPNTDSTYDIGTTSNRYATIYADTIDATTITGTIDADTLDSLDSADFVQIAGTQTITGDKTFSSDITISGNDTKIYFGGTGRWIERADDRSDLIKFGFTGGTWGGLQVDFGTAHWSVMGHQTIFGLYDDDNGKWIVQHNENSHTSHYHNGTEVMRTLSTGIRVNAGGTGTGRIDFGTDGNDYIQLDASVDHFEFYIDNSLQFEVRNGAAAVWSNYGYNANNYQIFNDWYLIGGSGAVTFSGYVGTFGFNSNYAAWYSDSDVATAGWQFRTHASGGGFTHAAQLSHAGVLNVVGHYEIDGTDVIDSNRKGIFTDLDVDNIGINGSTITQQASTTSMTFNNEAGNNVFEFIGDDTGTTGSRIILTNDQAMSTSDIVGSYEVESRDADQNDKLLSAIRTHVDSATLSSETSYVDIQVISGGGYEVAVEFHADAVLAPSFDFERGYQDSSITAGTVQEIIPRSDFPVSDEPFVVLMTINLLGSNDIGHTVMFTVTPDYNTNNAATDPISVGNNFTDVTNTVLASGVPTTGSFTAFNDIVIFGFTNAGQSNRGIWIDNASSSEIQVKYMFFISAH